MKTPLILSLVFAGWLSAPAARAQSVGVGTVTPSTKAALDIAATDKGLLIPRLTAAQRTAITSPPQGMMVYQTDGTASGGPQTGFWYYAGTPAAWVFFSPAADNLGNHTATQNINLTDKLLVGGTAGLPGSTGLSVNSNGRVGIGNTSPGFLLDANGTINGSSIYASSKLALSFGATQTDQNSFVGTGATAGINTTGAYNTAVGHGAATNLNGGTTTPPWV